MFLFNSSINRKNKNTFLKIPLTTSNYNGKYDICALRKLEQFSKSY